MKDIVVFFWKLYSIEVLAIKMSHGLYEDYDEYEGEIDYIYSNLLCEVIL